MISIWNLVSLRKVKSIEAHGEYHVSCLATTRDNKLISGSDGNEIKIWSSKKSALIRELTEHHSCNGQINALELTLDERLLSGSENKTINLWNLNTGECLQTICFSSEIIRIKAIDNNLICIGLSEINGCNLVVFDLNQMKERNNYQMHKNRTLYEMKLLSNFNVLTGYDNGEIELWKLIN